MNIDPLDDHSNPIFASLRRHGAFQQDNIEAARDAGWDTLATGRSAALRESLASLPEIRPEVVARGQELLADASYPGSEIVEKIARLITPLPED